MRARSVGWGRSRNVSDYGRQLEFAAIAAARRNDAALWYVKQSDLGNTFQESTGPTPGALSAPLGLILDRQYGDNNLGPELLPSAGGITILPSTESPEGNATIYAQSMYRVWCPAAGVKFNFGPGWQGMSPGWNYLVSPVTVTNGWRYRNESASAVTFEPSVKRVLGHHITQSTTGNKPTLTRVPRRLGPELLLDAELDNPALWTTFAGSTGGTSSISGGACRLTKVDAAEPYVLSAPVNVVAGRPYFISARLTVHSSVSNGTIYCAGPSYTAANTTGVHSINVAHTPGASGAMQVKFAAGGGNPALVDATIYKISCREVLEWSYVLRFAGSSSQHLNSALVTGVAGTFGLVGIDYSLGNSTPLSSGSMSDSNSTAGIKLRGDGTMWSRAGLTAYSTVQRLPGEPFVLASVRSAVLNTLYVGGISQPPAVPVAFVGSAASPVLGKDPLGERFTGVIGLAYWCNTDMPAADRIAIERFGAWIMGGAYAG